MSLGTIDQAAASAALQAELEAQSREFERVIDLFEHERPHPATGIMDQLPLDNAIDRLADIQAERARIRAHFAAAGGAAPEAPDPAAEIWDAINGTGRLDELRGHLRREWPRMVRRALDGLESREEAIDRLSRSGGGSDALERLHKLTEERDRLQARLATLAHDPGQKQRRVDQAIEAAGGAPALTACVRSALQFLGRFENRGEVAAADGAVADTEAALAKIDAKTPLGQALKARLTEAKATAKTAKTRAAHDAEANLQSLMSRAARADDNALDSLRSLAEEVPDAFPAGFAESLATLDEVTEEQLKGCLAVIVADHMLD